MFDVQRLLTNSTTKLVTIMHVAIAGATVIKLSTKVTAV